MNTRKTFWVIWGKWTIRLLLFCCLFNLLGCKKDEGKNPIINFVEHAGLLNSSQVLPCGTSFQVGITARKSETNVSLKTFHITKAINDGAREKIIEVKLKRSSKEVYNYTFQSVAAKVPDQKDKYMFIITNKYGAINQVYLTITSQ